MNEAYQQAEQIMVGYHMMVGPLSYGEQRRAQITRALTAAIEVGDVGMAAIGDPETWAEAVWPRLKRLSETLSDLGVDLFDPDVEAMEE